MTIAHGAYPRSAVPAAPAVSPKNTRLVLDPKLIALKSIYVAMVAVDPPDLPQNVGACEQPEGIGYENVFACTMVGTGVGCFHCSLNCFETSSVAIICVTWFFL